MGTRLLNYARGLAITLIGGTTLSTASGALISEDFTYPYTDGSTHVGGANGGSGFSTAWTGSTTRVYLRQGDLTYSGGGYAITQPTGLKVGTGLNSPRGVYRDFAGLTGEIWFSFLVQNTAPSSNTPYVALQWQPAGTANDTLYANYIQLVGGSININYNGTLTSNVVTGLVRSTTHLVVGKWTVGAGNDGLDVWINPANLNSLGTADFSNASADLMSSLSRIGVIGLATSSGSPLVFADAIRISDGNGNSNTAFGDVTGVPEPASMGLLAGAALGLARRRRRSR